MEGWNSHVSPVIMRSLLLEAQQKLRGNREFYLHLALLR
jgi:hypothetical protein